MGFSKYSFYFLLCIFALTSCGQNALQSTSNSTGVSGDSIDTTSAPINHILYIMLPTWPPKLASSTNPETSTELMQYYYGGKIIAFDTGKNKNDPPDDLIASFDEMSTYVKNKNNPEEVGCVTTSDPSDASTFSTTASQAGSKALPKGIDGTWVGYGVGGCSTWATALCNRILGRTSANQEITKEEWNQIATNIRQAADGGTKVTDQGRYYQNAGYCVTLERFAGDEDAYKDLENHLEKDHCDVKLFFYSRDAQGKLSNGHVETVVDVDAIAQTAYVNSWGRSARVKGGSKGNFSHTRTATGGTDFKDANGQPLWKPQATEVWMQYICECSTFEKIAKWAGF